MVAHNTWLNLGVQIPMQQEFRPRHRPQQPLV